MDDVLEMTFDEYGMKMRAYNLRLIDKERDMHMQAYLNHAVTSTVDSKDGKTQEPRYKKFEDFFDYDALYRAVTGEVSEAQVAKEEEAKVNKEKSDRLKRLMLKANQ